MFIKFGIGKEFFKEVFDVFPFFDTVPELNVESLK